MSLVCEGHFRRDCPDLLDYKFYLAFENAPCSEYITEKVWWNAYSKVARENQRRPCSLATSSGSGADSLGRAGGGRLPEAGPSKLLPARRPLPGS